MCLHARAEPDSDPRPGFEKGVGSCGADLLADDPEGLLASASAAKDTGRSLSHAMLNCWHPMCSRVPAMTHGCVMCCGRHYSARLCGAAAHPMVRVRVATQGTTHRQWWSAPTPPRWSWCPCRGAGPAAFARRTPLPAALRSGSQAHSDIVMSHGDALYRWLCDSHAGKAMS